MMPFLVDSLDTTIRKLMCIIVVKYVIDKAKHPRDLIKLDLPNKDYILPDSSVKLPTAPSSKLRLAKMKEMKKGKFRRECKKLVIVLLKKLMEKSPFRYKICRLSSYVSPVSMAIQKSRSVKLFSALVDMLFDAQHMKCQDGDLAKADYECFLSNEVAVDREKFSNFNISKERVDTFIGSYLNKNNVKKHAWMVTIFVFTLSHSQSHVERSFNINDDTMVENMHKD